MKTALRRFLLLCAILTGLPVAVMAQTEAVEYYGTDALGSIRIVFDANGTVLGRTDYTPFGDVFSSSGTQKHLYAGLFRDTESDQDYAEARMYQQRTGRFS